MLCQEAQKSADQQPSRGPGGAKEAFAEPIVLTRVTTKGYVRRMADIKEGTGEWDVGHTTLVKYNTLVAEDATPVRLPSHWLGPLEKKKVRPPTPDPLDRGLFEPTYGAWSSPRVIVKKRNRRPIQEVAPGTLVPSALETISTQNRSEATRRNFEGIPRGDGPTIERQLDIERLEEALQSTTACQHRWYTHKPPVNRYQKGEPE